MLNPPTEYLALLGSAHHETTTTIIIQKYTSISSTSCFIFFQIFSYFFAFSMLIQFQHHFPINFEDIFHSFLINSLCITQYEYMINVSLTHTRPKSCGRYLITKISTILCTKISEILSSLPKLKPGKLWKAFFRRELTWQTESRAQIFVCDSRVDLPSLSLLSNRSLV